MTVIFKFLNSLRKGHYGLSTTYWKLGVLVKSFLVIAIFASMFYLPLLTPLFLVHIYFMFHFIYQEYLMQLKTIIMV